ncbi:MAG: A/G-specific adenine glycosylase [Blautia sp.]|nr:A/G-specific adenine glycosylase [Blautia sp.]
MFREFDLEQLVEPLETWFLGHARVLPWRESPTAYRVWVSEIMLQQTRVEAVKPYFERFVRALPDVRALAECPEDRYLKLWEGLGYYNRVRNLNAAAKQIMEEFGGVIPEDYDRLLTLKGVGHYTAGAIASIAYNRPVPAVDGNVLRVLSRVSADDSDIMKQSVRTEMEKRLMELMQGKKEVHPRVFNQALMELGATVCLPNTLPRCAECPWYAFCEARQQKRTQELPVRKKAKARRIEDRTVFIVRDGGRVAIHKRADRGLLAGLYELPNHSGHMNREEALSYIRSLGYSPIRIQPLEDAKHVFSHVEWHMKGYIVLVEEPETACPAGQKDGGLLFVEAEDARERYAIPSAFARYAELMNIRVGRNQIPDQT